MKSYGTDSPSWQAPSRVKMRALYAELDELRALRVLVGMLVVEHQELEAMWLAARGRWNADLDVKQGRVIELHRAIEKVFGR